MGLMRRRETMKEKMTTKTHGALQRRKESAWCWSLVWRRTERGKVDNNDLERRQRGCTN